MHKRRFIQILAALTAVGTAPLRAQASVDVDAVVRHHATLVSASYDDVLASALALQSAVQAFVAAPAADTLGAARKAWLSARESYGPTEAFRFYGGPIDAEDGPEGRLNAWPLDEAYIDSVAGKPGAGLVNDRRVVLSKGVLAGMNERGGEENICTGWHAVEFMLWGQDTSADGPGNRPATDFIDQQAPNADRRRQYLSLVTELLVDDLRTLTVAWAPDRPNYRAAFERGGVESLRRMIVGIGSLSRGELAGERMEVALNSKDQEDEHSCFSDNTHRDIVGNALGIENVWLGRMKRRDGSLLQGPSLRDLVAQRESALADRTSAQLAASVAAAQQIQAPFDREIIGGNSAPGRLRVQATIDSLVMQSRDLVACAAALGITRLTLVKPA